MSIATCKKVDYVYGQLEGRDKKQISPSASIKWKQIKHVEQNELPASALTPISVLYLYFQVKALISLLGYPLLDCNRP